MLGSALTLQLFLLDKVFKIFSFFFLGRFTGVPCPFTSMRIEELRLIVRRARRLVIFAILIILRPLILLVVPALTCLRIRMMVFLAFMRAERDCFVTTALRFCTLPLR